MKYRGWHPFLSRLPARLAYRLATLGGYLEALSKASQRIAMQRWLCRVMPELDSRLAGRMAASLPRMQAREIQDVFRLPRLDTREAKRLVRLHGIAHFRSAHDDERPVILYSAHFSRLIMPAIALALTEHVVIHSLVADIDRAALSPAEHAYLRFKLNAMARLLGGDIIVRGRDTRALLTAMRQGGVVVIIVDAPAAEGDQPISIPFLNGSGRFSPGIVKLARRYNARLLPYFAIERDGALHGEIQKPVEIDGLDDTQAMAAIIAPVERMIRAHPEQWWMWPHLDALWSPLEECAD